MRAGRSDHAIAGVPAVALGVERERVASAELWFGAIALAALVSVVFALVPTLAAGWIWDDRADVLGNPAATPEGLVAALGKTNRPLLKASYALQRAWAGNDPLPFHLANLLLHLGAAALVFVLVRRALGGQRRSSSPFVALAAASIWALHPAVVDAVAPVSGRSALLSTVLLLVAFLMATGAAPPRRWVLLATALAAATAPLAKETALVLPALVALWQVTLGAREPVLAMRHRWLPILAGWSAAVAALAASDRQRELVAFSLVERGPLAALRGNVHAVVELARLWLAPGALSIDPAAPAEAPWSSPATLAKLALLAGLGVGAIALRRRLPVAALGVGWTLLALAPTNSVIWRLDPVAPRALYLASIGAIVLLATLFRALVDSRRSGRLAAGVATVAIVALAAALAVATRERAVLYADPVAVWADAAFKAPTKARPRANLGVALLLSGRLDEAEAALAGARILDPLDARSACALDAVRIRRSALRFTPERRNSP